MPINDDIEVGDLVNYFDNFCVVVSVRDNLLGKHKPKISTILYLKDMTGSPVDRELYFDCSVLNLKKL